MFAMKDTRQQSRHFASSSEKQHENPSIALQAMANTSLFLQRNLGNSYLQSTTESRQALSEASAQNGVPTIQRKCSCGGSCASCGGKEVERKIQTKLTVGAANDVYEQEADRVAEAVMRMPDSSVQTEGEQPKTDINIRRITTGESDRLNSAPDIDLNESGGQPLSPATRQFMEPRFGVDFGQVRLHTDPHAHQTAAQLQARAFAYGHHIWLSKGESEHDKPLMAHELTHVLQQANGTVQGKAALSQPGDVYDQEAHPVAKQIRQRTEAVLPGIDHESEWRMPAIQRQGEDEQQDTEEGVEVGDQLMLLPKWQLVTQPVDTGERVASATPTPYQGNQTSLIQRQNGGPVASDACSTPLTMRKVTSGKFEGGKTLDDYYPELVGKGFWDKNDTTGPFDNGSRAGSAVQLVGQYASPCAAGGSVFTLGQSATIVRARADGKKLMEGGKPLEGQTINDIKRSGRDASKPPFRQEFDFAVSMADPISGIPYATLKSYEFEVNLTSSLTGPGGSKSVDWGITTEASNAKVTKNELR